ncbi:probable E3 ubiquitin-protein ligase DTX2 isoform X2 [Clarias gariepinus]|uniref:probable E3 ubiquitin-protein ligase DTX2 isoform X2 n=1 Tax=Clarias gariepinus TaxID=13013 RepID=UPI00234DB744|nr:probable E3 ubiquitin-protein ligase DTX2 isoform X2 [Clarias gariepinus]
MATASGFSSGVSGSRSAASLSVSSAGAGGQAQGMAVVWEWQDDSGSWRPYSGQVSCFIEQCLQHHRSAGQPVTTVSLGQSDPSLAAYIIDIPSLKQFRQDTGKIRSVRRSLFPQSPVLGNGVLWEWANDEGSWTAYEMHTSGILEHSYLSRQAKADLGPHGNNYVVDFTTFEQINKTSGYRRRVRRQKGTPYPPAAASGTGSVIHSGPACTCQQCLSHGPMPGRSRHSFSAAAGPSSGYSPYPRRPLSVGNMAWGGPWSPAATSMAQPPGPVQSFPATPNGLSIPSIPLQLNGSSSVSAALAATPKPEEVIKKYMEEVRAIPDEDCMICMERLSCPSGYDSPEGGSQALQPSTVGKFTKCGHTLHMLCMLAMYNNGNKDGSLQCPSCKTIYGEKTGTQPKGKMEIYIIPQSLPGHPDCSTIQIIYNIPPGIQGTEHPNPGQPYTCRGFPRFCFLPDNDKGRKVLELLKVAWTRRLIFTVGTSNTTGEPDTVVWNEIHHKTEMMSNVSGHGYPDPNYLDNVLAELAAQGVTDDCLKRDTPRPREPE